MLWFFPSETIWLVKKIMKNLDSWFRYWLLDSISPILFTKFKILKEIHIIWGWSSQIFDKISLSHCLGMSYYVNFLGGLGSNGFHIKWRFGTHGSWKKSKSRGLFWSYWLNSTDNSAHSAWFLGKWAKLAVLFSL